MTAMMDTARLAVRAFEQRYRASWRDRVLRAAVDVTARSASASCLVVAPHPDDETIGCGATIARKRASGTPVRVVVVADGSSSHRSEVLDRRALAAVRAAEVGAACRELGVAEAELVRLGLEDETVATCIPELARRLGEHIDELAPDEILVASRRDWHQDHRAVNAAVRLALGERRHRPRVLEYPVWFWMHGPWDADPGGPWAPRRPVPFARGLLRALRPGAEAVSTAGFLGTKRAALLAHRSQTSNLTGEPDWAVLDDDFVASFLLPHEITFPAPIRRRP